MIEAQSKKIDHLTVTEDINLDSVRVKLTSDFAHAVHDLGMVPNSALTRDSIMRDPGQVTRDANLSAFHSYLSSANSSPNVQKVLFFPPGSIAISGPLNTAAYSYAFKNLTITGVRSEYTTQTIETGNGGREWGSRLDIYNANENDYFIDLPGSTDKTIRPSLFTLQNMVWYLGDQASHIEANILANGGSYSEAATKYASAKGQFLRIGDRDKTGAGNADNIGRNWSDLARGINISGMTFSDWILAKNNELYRYMWQQQGDNGVTINWKNYALVEFNRCYDLLINKSSFRGGRGSQLWLANCDSPMVIGSRHMLPFIGIQNGVVFNDPSNSNYDRDFMVDDGVPGKYYGIHIEQPAMSGVLSCNGLWTDSRIDAGYQSSYTYGTGPGYYPMPLGCDWSISFQDLAQSSQAEEQYIQFTNISNLTITPDRLSSSRTAKLSDYICPGMVLELTPSSPSSYGYVQVPPITLIITAIDDVNNRAYFFGGYRSSSGTSISVNFISQNISGTAANCIRMIGIPFIMGTQRGGISQSSITQNAYPTTPLPRHVISYDRCVVPVGPVIGGPESHTGTDQDDFRTRVSACGRGGQDMLGSGVAYMGPIPPKHFASKNIFQSTDFSSWPQKHKDFTAIKPEDFDYFASPLVVYDNTQKDWKRMIEMIQDGDESIATICTHQDAWKPFANLPAATYDFTIRTWCPFRVGGKAGTSITRVDGGDYDGKALLTFADDHWFPVGYSLIVGNTVTYDGTYSILDVPNDTTVILNTDYISDFVGTVNCTLIDNQKLHLNFRTNNVAPGTNWVKPASGINYSDIILENWDYVTGTTAANTTDIYVYTASMKVLRIAWIGLKLQ